MQEPISTDVSMNVCGGSATLLGPRRRPWTNALSMCLLGSTTSNTAGDHLAGGFGHDGLLPAKAPQGCGHVGNRSVVVARVRGVAEEEVEGNPLDFEGACIHS